MVKKVWMNCDFYDRMIIGEEQERELRRVCEAFYEAAQPAS